MNEYIKKFIGKECIIYTIMSESGSIQGTINELNENWILITDPTGNEQIVNAEYITRIREYPRDKKGKKKSVVLD
ncbi:MAG: DUF6897 domain-containing protein [Huintestinicola sp.]